MEFQPHPYQTFSLNEIGKNPYSAIFYPVGMGKTVVALTAIDVLLSVGEVSRVLVIAPLRVARQVWTDETEKWDHLKHLKISRALGSAERRVLALKRPADIYVINRENVPWLVRHYKKEWPFDMVVIDELSSFKHHRSQRFRALRAVRPFIKRVVGLTATPAPNGLIDLWPQIYLLDRGVRLGRNITAFRDRFFAPEKVNGYVVYSYRPIAGAEEEIYRRIGDICVSLKAEDWIDMPERLDRTVSVKLPDAARKQYDKMERDMLLPLKESDVVAGTAGVLVGKLLQMANGAVYDENRNVQEIHDAKIDALEDLVEAQNGNPMLVFYSYKHDVARILKRMPDVKVLKTTQDIRDWNDGKIPVLLAHPASAGHGLNMQFGGHQVTWFGPPWSLELYEQAIGRVLRQGQKHAVIVHHLIAENTVDGAVMKALSGKHKRQQALLEAVKWRIDVVTKGGSAA